jgi:hypothetical protein
MAIVQIDYKISWDDFEDLGHTASLGGIDYWAKKTHMNKQDRVFVVFDDEGIYHSITQQKVEAAIADIYNRNVYVGESIWKSVEWVVLHQEYGEIDASAADAIFQLACFGEIVYG